MEENKNYYKQIYTQSIVLCLKIYKKFLIANDGNDLNVYDLNNLNLIKTISDHDDIVQCLIIYKNLLFSGSEDRTIKIYNLENDFKFLKIINLNYFVDCMKINEDYLISSSSTFFLGEINIFDLKNNFNLITTLKYNTIFTIKIYNQFLITGSYHKKEITIFNLKDNFKVLKILNYPVNSLIFDENLLLSGSPELFNNNGEINIFDINNNFNHIKTIKN